MTLKLVFTAALLDAQHERDRVENKPVTWYVAPLGKEGTWITSGIHSGLFLLPNGQVVVPCPHRGLALGQHRRNVAGWRAVCGTLSNVTGPGIELRPCEPLAMSSVNTSTSRCGYYNFVFFSLLDSFRSRYFAWFVFLNQ